jgi:hypothetical protein
MWRIRITSAAAAALLVLALAACGQSPAAQPAQIEPTSLPPAPDSRQPTTASAADPAPTLETASTATAVPASPTSRPAQETAVATRNPEPASTQVPSPSTSAPTTIKPPLAPTVSWTGAAPTSTAVPDPKPSPSPTRVSVPPTPAPTTNIQFSRTTPFVPLDQPVFLSASDGDYLPAADLVLGLDLRGQARAYPVRMLSYHHIVNDTVAGQPVLITY